ncbi:hypothetical protein AAY473_006283, partial [Plecturocebus cupreus]
MVLGFWIYTNDNGKVWKSFKENKTMIPVNVRKPSFAFLNPQSSEIQLKEICSQNSLGKFHLIRKLSTHNVHLRLVSPAKASEVLSTISVTVRAAMQEPPGSLRHTMLENKTGPGARAADKSRSGRTMTPSTHFLNYREEVTDFFAPGLGQLVLENQSASELSSIISCWSEMRNRVSLCHPGWSTVGQSWLTVTSTSWVLAVLLPEPPRSYVNCAV